MPQAVLGFLGRNELGLPLWGWALAIGGAVALVYFLPKITGGGTDQAASGAGTGQAALPSSIDPLTGVPYSIESQINPATGLPAYYGTGTSNQPPQQTTPPPIPRPGDGNVGNGGGIPGTPCNGGQGIWTVDPNGGTVCTILNGPNGLPTPGGAGMCPPGFEWVPVGIGAPQVIGEPPLPQGGYCRPIGAVPPVGPVPGPVQTNVARWPIPVSQNIRQ